jgi:hypothetical protein
LKLAITAATSVIRRLSRSAEETTASDNSLSFLPKLRVYVIASRRRIIEMELFTVISDFELVIDDSGATKGPIQLNFNISRVDNSR